MISYPKLLQQIQDIFKTTISEDIDFTSTSSASFLCGSIAECAFLIQQQQNIFQNTWNVNTVSGAAQDMNTGWLFNLPRVCQNIKFTATLFNNGSGSTINITTSDLFTYTNSNGVYNFTVTQNVAIANNATENAVMIFVGINYTNLPIIPSGTLFFNANNPLLQCTSTEEFDPSFESDEEYRIKQETIFDRGLYGMPLAIKYALEYSLYVNKCEVYFGNIVNGPYNIDGSAGTYSLPYGQILVLASGDYIGVGKVLAVQNQVANLILGAIDPLNITYVADDFENQVNTTATSPNGQPWDITYYTSIPNNTSIEITFSTQEIPQYSSSDVENLTALIQAYVDGIRIGYPIYTGQISTIFANYNPSINAPIISIVINSVEVSDLFTQDPDQEFIFESLSLVYE